VCIKKLPLGREGLFRGALRTFKNGEVFFVFRMVDQTRYVGHEKGMAIVKAAEKTLPILKLNRT